MSCLIIDDSEEFVASASRLLASQGIDVVAAAFSRAQALELITALRPDVALVDVELGDDDGIQLSHELAAKAPATRIVIISTHDRDDLAHLIADSPAVGFLPKNELGAAALERLLG
jgi:two-component system, NarL family, nitrate/nitrite response regulator NarL